MPGTINVLNRAVSLDTAPKFEAYTGVRLWYDDEQFFFAGDETGRVLEADNPWATQSMAESVLASISGYSYQPFEAGSAILDPAAELGDGVNVGGVYGPLASITTRFDAMCASDISAPADEEIDHEYPYLSPAEREYKRNKARTYSLISKTSEEIRLEVHKLQENTELSLDELEKNFGEDLDDLEKAFGKDLDDLAGNITETLKQYSTITQTAEKIELAVSTSKEYANQKTGEVVASLSKYSTIEQTDSKISTAVSTSKEYTDGKITGLSGDVDKALSDLSSAFDVKLKNYSTIEQTDSKITTSVNTSKAYTDAKTGDVVAKLEKYSTIEQTDSKISTAVSTTKQYTDRKITDLSTEFGTDLSDLEGSINATLKTYSTIEQTDSKIATSVSESKTYTDTKTGSITESLKNYSTIEQTAEKIELAVSTSKVYTDKKTGAVAAKLAKYSTIEQTAEKIELAVTGLQNESQVNSLISQAMDKIELSVYSSEGSTSLKLTSNGVEINSETVDLSVKALNISGLIQAEQIKLKGSITWDDLTREAKSRVDQGKGDDNPTYLETSYIGKTKIMSPSIYGGQFYATGQGAYDGPAYYIYNGCDISGGDADLGELLGYISYDNNGAGTEIEAKERVFFRTLDDVALKIQAGGNISVESDSGYVYFGSPIRAGNGLNIRGSFGTSLPAVGEKGDLFFLIE